MGPQMYLLYYILFPILSIIWRVSQPLLAEISPYNKQVVLVHPGSQIQFEPDRDFPILDFIGLVKQHGYDAEEHKVTTKDGYILGLHRVPGGPKSPRAPGKPAVFIQHGLSQSSDSWVLRGPNNDLVFLLVDAGYDVWLGNIRGTPYSQEHVIKDVKSESYWSFSFHEMGIFDIPAFIDTILSVTGNEKLTYLGFSMGTTMSYITFSMLPEYNDKVDVVYNFAPVAYWMAGLERLPIFLKLVFGSLQDFVDYFKIKEFLPQSAFRSYWGHKLCSDKNKVTQALCFKLICQFGLDCHKANKTIGQNALSFNPMTVSYLTLYHYHQNINKRTFQQYDYGERINMMKYGQKEAPYYNLSTITAPYSIWYGNDDYFVDPKDAERLGTILPNVELHKVADKKWNHADFLWAKTAKKLVYEKLPLLKNKPIRSN